MGQYVVSHVCKHGSGQFGFGSCFSVVWLSAADDDDNVMWHRHQIA